MSTLLAPHDVTNLYIWCRSFERTTPIYFDKLVVDETQSAADFLHEKAEIISLASTSSLPDIIPMGLCINSHQLAGHMDYFRHHLTGMSPRLPEIYSTYRLFAHEVILITWLITCGWRPSEIADWVKQKKWKPKQRHVGPHILHSNAGSCLIVYKMEKDRHYWHFFIYVQLCKNYLLKTKNKYIKNII